MRQEGFALLAVMLIVLATSAATVTLLPSPRRSAAMAAPTATTESRIDRIVRGAVAAAHLTGRVYTSESEITPWIEHTADRQTWIDPYRSPSTLSITTASDFGVRAAGAGPDRLQNTADDLAQQSISFDTGVARTRPRLRSLRALYVSRWFAPYGLSSSSAQQVATAVRQWAIAQRRRRYASNSEQPGLLAAQAAAETTIQSIMVAHGVPAPPTSVSGPGGLADALGIHDSLCFDGHGRELRSHPQVGLASDGPDHAPGTLDDQ